MGHRFICIYCTKLFVSNVIDVVQRLKSCRMLNMGTRDYEDILDDNTQLLPINEIGCGLVFIAYCYTSGHTTGRTVWIHYHLNYCFTRKTFMYMRLLLPVYHVPSTFLC